MIKPIIKKLKYAKILAICTLVLFVALIPLFVNGSLFGWTFTALMILSIAFVTCTMVFFKDFYPVIRNVIWLKNNGFEDVADDIDLNTPTFEFSKLYCGSKAFFSKQNCLVIPYSEIAWVYVTREVIGFVPTAQHINIACADGKRFVLLATTKDITALVQNYVSKVSDKVIIGYGHEQQKQYNKIKRNHKKQAVDK